MMNIYKVKSRIIRIMIIVFLAVPSLCFLYFLGFLIYPIGKTTYQSLRYFCKEFNYIGCELFSDFKERLKEMVAAMEKDKKL